jgi:hypothetical protein
LGLPQDWKNADEMAGTEWQDLAFCQGRFLSKAAAKETQLRLELEGLFRRWITESWVPISSHHPELLAFCTVIASVMPTA